MIWQDGERLGGRNNEETCILCPSLVRILEVTDNLIHQKRIPVMVHLFIQAGTLNGRSMRSIQYDSVTDRYPRFLIEEIPPRGVQQVQRPTGWVQPCDSRTIVRRYRRVQCRVASPRPVCSGGFAARNVYRRRISERGAPRRSSNPNLGASRAEENIRVWIRRLRDYENEWGSWPLQILQLANSLKFRGYDFRSS